MVRVRAKIKWMKRSSKQFHQILSSTRREKNKYPMQTNLPPLDHISSFTNVNSILTMFHQGIKCQLNRYSRIEHNDFSTCPKNRVTRLRFQKRHDGLLSCIAHNFAFSHHARGRSHALLAGVGCAQPDDASTTG